MRGADSATEAVEIVGPGNEWPEAVSDGLTLTCSFCGCQPRFDYRVSEDLWHSLVPDAYRRGVVCLPCLDRLAAERGVTIGLELLEVQFTGEGHTIIMRPTRVIDYRQRLDSATCADSQTDRNA